MGAPPHALRPYSVLRVRTTRRPGWGVSPSLISLTTQPEPPPTPVSSLLEGSCVPPPPTRSWEALCPDKTPTHARRLLCEVPPSPLRGSQNRWHEREREQGLLWAPWDGHPPPDAVRAPAPVINVPNSETHRRFQTQTPGAIGFHDFSRSLGYGLARICSPLNYSSGIRKTQQHLSLPWRPRLIPPHSQTLREPEIIPGPIYDCPRPCPP